MKYSTLTVSPGAWVTRNKSRLKIYESSKVFLNDGEEFEIELFNPLVNRVLAQIKLNGNKTISIVINPGQRIFLERFLEENRKFMFSTYEVENTKQSKEAIANNGKVDISFYEEYAIHYNNLCDNLWYSGNNRRLIINTPGTSGNPALYYSNLTNSSNIAPLTSTSVNNEIETGRIESGGKSDQNFSSTSGNFNWYIGSLSYHILPYSTKLKESSDIRQYCTNCGTRVRNSNWKYCPKCGTKLD